MTTQEKADRYDALMMAIRFTVQTYQKTIKTLPTADEVGNNIIKACEYGKKIAYENTIMNMERWLT